jgi:hypothetical protein
MAMADMRRPTDAQLLANSVMCFFDHFDFIHVFDHFVFVVMLQSVCLVA